MKNKTTQIILAVVVIAVVLVAVYLIIQRQKSAEQKGFFLSPISTKQGCYDSDGGVNSFQKGMTQNIATGTAYKDSCINEFTLREYYCVLNPGGGAPISSIDIDCRCSNGQCPFTISLPQPLSPSVKKK